VIEQHPQFAVSKWIGHSIEVSGKHYANAVPDELLAKAATGAKGAAQKAAQQAPETSSKGQKMQKPSEEGISHMSATTRELSQVLEIQLLGGGGN
jgi:hypothetical protein